jgi:hypothetical protein
MRMFRFLAPRHGVSLFVAPLLIALCGVMVAGPAEAKGPEAKDLPSIEEIVQKAKDAKAAAAEALLEAARDPRKEAIVAYRDGKLPLEGFAPLTEMINNSKDDEIQVYRTQASQAILLRFKNENLDDPQVRKTRAALGLEIIDLMKAKSGDQVGLAVIQEILQTWWATKNRELRFKATDKWKVRMKAWRGMRSYLTGGER